MSNKPSSIQDKTVRPGLLDFSFYLSDRHPAGGPPPIEPAKPRYQVRRGFLAGVAVVVVVVAAAIGLHALNGHTNAGRNSRIVITQTKPAAKAAGTVAKPTQSKTPAATTSNACTGNTLSKFILVSISQRHLWACQGASQVYDSPVITGMEMYAADLTPPGTYHIYAKETNVVLKGSDSTGSWSDPVSYWMPWLENQYGVYGFHDATWRPNSAFGNVSPDSTNASHGCVELPLATAAWLYNWAPVGTTLTIES